MQLGEASRPQDLGDPHLGRLRLRVDGALEPLALGGQPNDAGASVGWIGHSHQVSVTLQVAEQVVDRLLCDPHLVCELGGT